MLGGGQFGKIYLKSLKRQADDEAFSTSKREEILRTMGDDRNRRVSPQTLPASRALQFRSKPPKALVTQKKLTLEKIPAQPKKP